MLSDYIKGGKQSNTANKPKAASAPVATSTIPSASKLTEGPRGKFSGDGTKFDTQYKINEYSYPIDLLGSEYGGNYAVFYINVSNDSKLAKGDDTLFVADIPQRERGYVVGSNYTETQVVTGSAIGSAGVGAAAGVATGGGENPKTRAAKGVLIGAGLSLGGVEAIKTQSTSLNRQQKRLKTAIALHIPNQLTVRYGMNWGEEDTAAFAMGAAGADAIAKYLSGSLKNVDQLAGPAKSIAAAIALDKLPGGAAISAASGLVSNPRKEQIFKSVDFRTFQFMYEFYPRSPEEAKYVQNIIKEFKLHMHPEYKDTGEFLYVYPSEFDIYYYQDNDENMYLHRHTSCVLTEMTVNYSPQGQFTTFADGMPTQINISLNFKELALLTKDKILDGF